MLSDDLGGAHKRNSVENPAKRYNVGTITEGLRYDKDGSLDVYLQNEKTEENKSSNWLPVPKEPFLLYVRVYMPSPSALNGTYDPPPVIILLLI